MATKHRLSRANVRRHAPSSLGVYKLYNSRTGPVRYVGRSSNLQDRLLDWASKSNYGYFVSESMNSLREAWRREVNLYHQNIDTVDNERHPAAPEGMTCHRCSAV